MLGCTILHHRVMMRDQSPLVLSIRHFQSFFINSILGTLYANVVAHTINCYSDQHTEGLTVNMC